MYRVILSAQAKKEYQYFIRSGNKVAVNKILSLLEDIAEHPYIGIGKPEPLKYELAGYWSRRINSEHRIVYSVDEEVVRGPRLADSPPSLRKATKKVCAK